MTARVSFTVFMLCLVAIFTSLCVWQYQRLHWKTEIIETLEARYAQNPLQNELNPPFEAFQYGFVTGRFAHEQSFLYGPFILNGKPAFELMTPLSLSQEDQILVARGQVTEGSSEGSGAQDVLHAARKAQMNREVRIAGLIYPVEQVQGSFLPADTEDRRYRLPETSFYLKKESQSPIDPLAQDLHVNVEKWYPRNKHFDYMLFWGGMALLTLLLTGYTLFRGFTRVGCPR